MEQFPQVEGEAQEKIVSEGECRKIAQDILARYQQILLEASWKPVDGGDAVFEPAISNLAIDKNLRKIPPEILSEYRGHGITRGDQVDRLTAAISILENGAMKGDSGRLAQSGYIDAYSDGDFLVISHKGEELMEWDKKGSDRRPLFVSLGENPLNGRDIRAVKINLGALIVNARFYPIVEELRRMFPDKKILYANELVDYVNSEDKD